MVKLPLVFNKRYLISRWETNHRFPMLKYKFLQELLLKTKIANLNQFFEAESVSKKSLEMVHNKNYVEAFISGKIEKKKMRKIGLPWSRELVDKTLFTSGGTILCGTLALENGIACNLGGGTHHAFSDFGSGFCIFNDVSVAIRHLLSEGKIKKALIIDLDVHQGDGTAFIHKNEKEIYTFSMHCKENFPFLKQESDFDLPLDQGTKDEEYLNKLYSILPKILKIHNPDLIFYNAGCDVHQNDVFGKFSLTSKGIFLRDYFVFKTAAKNNTPIASVMGGGYSIKPKEIAKRHLIMFKAASTVSNS